MNMIHHYRLEIFEKVDSLSTLSHNFDRSSVSDAISIMFDETTRDSPYMRTFQGFSETGPFSKAVLRISRLPSGSTPSLVTLHVGNGVDFTLADLANSRYFSSEEVELESSALSEGVSSFRLTLGGRTLYWEFDNETGLLQSITIHDNRSVPAH
ncbi:hypothetical protein AB0C34_14430 [Nocardia sp. NPDC049220]|uniref:hypothetical protein n=1 Tax=Nocardia sp. NPDC049220 TaxID=3155273 RepID=UPI0033F6E94F